MRHAPREPTLEVFRAEKVAGFAGLHHVLLNRVPLEGTDILHQVVIRRPAHDAAVLRAPYGRLLTFRQLHIAEAIRATDFVHVGVRARGRAVPPAQKRAHRSHTRGTKIKISWGFGRVLLIESLSGPLHGSWPALPKIATSIRRSFYNNRDLTETAHLPTEAGA